MVSHVLPRSPRYNAEKKECSERDLKEVFSLAKKRPGAPPLAHTRDNRPTTRPLPFPPTRPHAHHSFSHPTTAFTRTGKWHCARTTPPPHRRLGALIARSPRHHARPAFLIGVLITGVPISVDSFGCVKLIMVARLEHLSEPPALQPLPRPTNPHDHHHGPALTTLAPHCPTQ